MTRDLPEHDWSDIETDPTDDPTPDPTADDGSDYWVMRTVAGGPFVLDAPEIPPAVWGDGEALLWAAGESLMICGPAGVGKTTLAVQIVAARAGIGAPTVLGMPIRPGTRKVLYLAMDRPPQIARAMARLFEEEHRDALNERLIVWKGPPPHDLARRPDTLVDMCERADADTVIVDSLKDGVLKLSDDEAGGGYNKARQRALVAGVEVVELHHQRKAGGDNKKPSKIDDVYGSTWLTAGAGSVLILWGEPGDPVVELIHLKQPMETVGPMMVLHDPKTGRSEIHHQVDLVALIRQQRHLGMSVRLAASVMFGIDKPSASQMEKARRKINSLVEAGYLVAREGSGQLPTTYFLAENREID
jgi:replicative DNA helicase